MNGIIAVKFLNALIIFSVLFLYLAKSINGDEQGKIFKNNISLQFDVDFFFQINLHFLMR